jgi:hypothetical protein
MGLALDSGSYLFFFIWLSQQMMSHFCTHPQVSSTDTTSPHTEHLY